jgi:hypothetical protein
MNLRSKLAVHLFKKKRVPRNSRTGKLEHASRSLHPGSMIQSLLFDAVAVYRYECMYVCWQVWVCVRVFVISFRYMNACMCMYVCVCVHLRMQKKLGVCCMYVCTCNKPRWTSHCVHVTPKEYSREAFCHVCRLIHKQHAYLIFVAAHYLQWAAAHETFSAHVYHTHTNKICSRPPFSSHAVMMWW